MEDSKGRLVPLTNVRPHDLQRDELVRDLVARCEAHRAEAADLKARLLDDIAAHIQLVAEKYDVQITGKAGNVSLVSYDGRLKVERVTAERISVGEQIQAAEHLVRQILDEIEEPTARAIVDRAFRRDRKTGELSASRLIDLIAVDIDDERWRRAVQAIRDALQTSGTATYFRAYRRDDQNAPWQQIAIDFSAVAPKRTDLRPVTPHAAATEAAARVEMGAKP
jgi:hypothetical protein